MMYYVTKVHVDENKTSCDEFVFECESTGNYVFLSG